ncbi:hypothetical protein LB505_010274 [Fusarium chuoi]|nr:hypothetical protein LB505_010274 [Fusarium chuoi]
MYNSLTRIQNTFGFFTTVAFVVAAFIAASDLLAPRAPDAGIFQKTNAQVADHTTTALRRRNTPSYDSTSMPT